MASVITAEKGNPMSKKTLIIVGGLIALVLVGLVYLMTAEIPTPSKPITKTLNNDRFPS